MDINFIKWLVGHAEGFEFKEDGFIKSPGGFHINLDLSIYNLPNGFDGEKSVVEKWYLDTYPLLLQKARIGWNKVCSSGERILEVVGSTSERYLKYGKYQNIIDLGQTEDDKAIEQALKYIYSQEIK